MHNEGPRSEVGGKLCTTEPSADMSRHMAAASGKPMCKIVRHCLYLGGGGSGGGGKGGGLGGGGLGGGGLRIKSKTMS